MRPVVFVMTDVVGSTALWESHGDAMRSALELHDSLVHGAMQSAGGRVFKHTGDGMVAAFDDADAAVAASLRALEVLADGDWGETGPLAVRVSVHAGAASQRDGDFFGPPVNRVARINGVGHGGQVLVSDVARQLMAEPGGVDLGVHQLRDLSEPVRLWQLDEGVHPALRTLKTARHNLPVMPTEFIGRQAEVDELRALVDRHRLVTITGVGGCGKTRLALEVAAVSADRFPGGVWFVDLTTERNSDRVAGRSIGALGLVKQPGVSGGPVDVLAEATAGAATLLIVDNCEHLIDDVADFAATVLAGAPSVTMLATSRESLSVDGEWVWRIPSLRDAAVELFVDRAAAAGVVGLEEHLDRIEEICVQLDEIPLAIELAAARLSSLSLEELAGRLGDRFALLSGGRGRRQRQQTLLAMMDWSYGLLDDVERSVLNQLAVFSGTFALAGVEAVVDTDESSVLDVLDSLVDKSLVVPSVGSGRYRLLETVRLYAFDQLVRTDQLVASRDRHLAWIDDLFGAERSGSTPAGETWDLEERKLAEVSNAVAAMEWATESGRADALLSLYVGGQQAWVGTASIAVSLLDRVPEPSDPALRSEWLATSAHIGLMAGDEAAGFRLALEAATMVDELIEAGRIDEVAPAVVSLMWRGMFLAHTRDFEAALAESDRLSRLQVGAVARYRGYMSLLVRCTVMMLRDDDDACVAAAELVAEGRLISRFAYDNAVVTLAMNLSIADRFAEALPAALHAFDSPVLGQSPRMNALVPAAKSLAALGRHQEALDIIQKDFGPMIDSQRDRLHASQLVALALVLHTLQRDERAAEVAGAARALSTEHYVVVREVEKQLSNIVADDAEPAPLPVPESSGLTPDHVARLIDDLVTEIRHLIAGHTTTADARRAEPQQPHAAASTAHDPSQPRG